MTEKIYLVDGSGYIFRAFYAVAPLTTKAGFPTNALFGFSRMMLKLLNEAESGHVVAVFDAGRETFRTKLYPQYKANRSECPAELLVQMPFFREIAQALGLQLLEQPGFEADDIIATLTKRLTSAGHEVVIVSADKDLLQLVSSQVHVWDTLKDKHLRAPEVKEKFGVGPERVVEILGLMGDSSDNIPGLSGVGPKTAAQLIEKYGDVESVIANAKTILEDSSIRNRKKICQQIELDHEILRLSRRLVELDSDVPVKLRTGIDPEADVKMLQNLSDTDLVMALNRKRADISHLKALTDRFEFSSLFGELLKSEDSSHSEKARSEIYQCVFASDFDRWLKEFVGVKEFAFDLETTSLDPRVAQLVGVSFCWSNDRAFYIPLAHTAVSEGQVQVSVSQFLEACGGVLSNSHVKKIGQNLKYDIGVLACQGIQVRGIEFDCMIAAYLLNPDKGSFNLTTLSQDYLGRSVIEYEDLVKKGETFAVVPIERATPYGCQDAHHAWLLRAELLKRLQEAELTQVFYEIEMPLVAVLSQMELDGVKLDVEYLQGMSHEFESKLAQLRTKLFELAGTEFNMNSPKQLSDILFNKLGLSTKGLKKTKTGISTDSGVLEKLRHLHPLPDFILQYRLLHKLKSTYIDALPTQVSLKTCRLHSSFNQTGTGTGRLSSSDPNLQNIPIQTEEGRRVRGAFVAETGNLLISADYSQIELRLLAHMSADPVLIEAFRSGQDIHSQTAREIMGLSSLTEVTPELRRVGKTINFGVIYGMGPFRLSRELGIPMATANAYIENYFKRYAGVRQFFDRLEVEAKSRGYVSTMFGRRRLVGDINSDGRDEGFVIRAALNAPIQGSAADIIKLAMLALARRLSELRAENLSYVGLRMIMQIHDELVFECPEELKEQASQLIKHEMEQVAKLNVPLQVEIGSGKSWQEAH